MKNRLADATSPYLRQHAENPVAWYPWGAEALEAAKREDKPIFLSIGYSTCHWCHMMAHESFDDPDVAAQMNAAFVAIKMDREEYPELDNIFMKACRVMTGGGGWPLNVVLSPDLEPIYAASYIPKLSSFRGLGMLELVPKLKESWDNNRDDLKAASAAVIERLHEINQVVPGQTDGLVETAFARLKQDFDSDSGGFGRGFKFPCPHLLLFLLGLEDDEALEMVSRTLTAIRSGGIYDQLGFGVHRYSTDPNWLVPHFEKMLYDQAMLVMAYSECFARTRDPFFKRVAEEIVAYTVRDLRRPDGLFMAAEDADSDGVEGKFYLWDIQEAMFVLDEEEMRIFLSTFNVRQDGNFEGSGRYNILHTRQPATLESIVQVEKVAARLLEERENRNRPFRDSKILVDWNALMIAALARAGRQLERPEYLEMARQAAANPALFDQAGRLKHTTTGISAKLDDYAFFIWALLELGEYDRASLLQQQMIELFHAPDGGFYLSPKDEPEILVRVKEIYDGAYPSGVAVAIANQLRLDEIEGTDIGGGLLGEVAGSVAANPAGHTHLLAAISGR